MSTLSNTAPIVSIVNNTVTALSTDVARFFHKEHFNVIRDIENLLKNLPSSRAFNFEGSTVEIKSNLKNVPSKIIKAYRMTRDGFTLLVMGWTGEKALQFKLAWLDAFNAMERQLCQCPALDKVQTLTPSQQRQIRVEVALRAQKCAANYQTIYRALKARFQVARYDQIPQSQFREALQFIQTVDLSVPEVQNFDDFQESFGEFSNAQAQHLSPQEIQALANVCHLLRLGKPTFQQVYKVLSAAYSPMAPRFYSLMTEPFLCLWKLEEVVKRNQNLLLN